MKVSNSNPRRDDVSPITTLAGFWAEINRLPERAPRGLEEWWNEMKAAGLDPMAFSSSRDERETSPNLSWHHLRGLIEDAVARDDTEMLMSCFDIANRALEAGVTGEMWEASYVSFIEDLRLPPDRKRYERVLRLMPNTLRQMWINESPHARRTDDRLPQR